MGDVRSFAVAFNVRHKYFFKVKMSESGVVCGFKGQKHNWFLGNHKAYRFHVIKLSKTQRIPEYLDQLREEFSDLNILRQND
jgi:hypothetical protein